ncbi:MAG: hypothetical protein GX173_03220, partial [Ruminococcaceae bacterium]|nr:hypothetical protein [Oscillospiraceae bacterium]
YDPKYGARPLRKTIQRLLEDPLSDMILSGSVKDKIAVSADYQDNRVTFDFL